MMISDAFQKAMKILVENMDKLDQLSQKLIEKEVLTGIEVEEILGKFDKNRFPILVNIKNGIK